MAGHMQLKTGFNGEQQHALFQINEGEKAWAHVTLELPEFTDLLSVLAQLRTQFTEQVPMEVDIGARLAAVADPVWQVMSDVPGLPSGASLLLLRHPGFGWLSFAVPGDGAREMGRALIRSAQSTGQRMG